MHLLSHSFPGESQLCPVAKSGNLRELHLHVFFFFSQWLQNSAYKIPLVHFQPFIFLFCELFFYLFICIYTHFQVFMFLIMNPKLALSNSCWTPSLFLYHIKSIWFCNDLKKNQEIQLTSQLTLLFLHIQLNLWKKAPYSTSRHILFFRMSLQMWILCWHPQGTHFYSGLYFEFWLKNPKNKPNYKGLCSCPVFPLLPPSYFSITKFCREASGHQVERNEEGRKL